MTLEDILKIAPVVPVLTIEEAAHAVPLARALAAGGLRALEITLRTSAAIEAAALSRPLVTVASSCVVWILSLKIPF